MKEPITEINMLKIRKLYHTRLRSTLHQKGNTEDNTKSSIADADAGSKTPIREAKEMQNRGKRENS
jgi:hypothetical protein